jgi:hypothetical protein
MADLLEKKHPDVADGIDGLAGMVPKARLTALVKATGERLRGEPNDPHALLARLPASIYLSATPDSLLVDALTANGRPPSVDFARWRPRLRNDPSSLFNGPNKPPASSRQNPLVFYMFGTLDNVDSLVVTEDDFFDYLIQVVSDKDNTVIPLDVRTALAENALMLLGFDLDDWAF